ncbi:hypothetical protein [Streptomyces sp. NBC_01373]|uniref:hypothetical protein n=1 Tax=Streptomyces sp. NBC_01373 TaxID=2903843 RepID=UPI0022538461|nr:hypothetical protein [Streptomyces sp. NBC_01373]MCX4705692.1 hypothetical protein [Streptomyces sp. NBC_01373]
MTDKKLSTVPAAGNLRIGVDPIPAGIALDLEPFAQLVAHTVVERLMNDRDLGERFDRLRDEQSPSDPYAIERALPFEQLVDDLVAAAGTKVPVYGLRRCLQLATRIISTAVDKLCAPDADQAEGRAAA